MKTCPRCASSIADEAMRCDCGYVYSLSTMRTQESIRKGAPITGSTPHRPLPYIGLRRLSLGIAVIGWIFAALAALGISSLALRMIGLWEVDGLVVPLLQHFLSVMLLCLFAFTVLAFAYLIPLLIDIEQNTRRRPARVNRSSTDS